MNIPSLLSDIAGLVKNERTEVAVRLATITSYVPGDLFVELKIGGSTSVVRGRFINYDPVVGETVQVLQDGLDPIVIGKVGSTGPGLAVPIGAVVGWGNTVPQDWERCEGQSTSGRQALALVWGSNVPDLRYAFIQGAGPGVPVGTRGGQNDQTLTEANLPAHNHWTSNKPSGQEAPGYGLIPADGFQDRVLIRTGDLGDITSNAGGGLPFDNRPTFFTLTYIVKVG